MYIPINVINETVEGSIYIPVSIINISLSFIIIVIVIELLSY